MLLEAGKKIFGTDGVRGRANHFPMTVEIALALGRAAGYVFRKKAKKSRVVIGKDTRLSCYMFENALISGLCSMGVDTLMVGPLPTPGVAFITRAYRADAGVVISASHNSFQDNGIKFFNGDGFKLPDEMEEEIEKLIRDDKFDDFIPLENEIGKNFKVNDADGRYIEFAKGTFPRKQNLNGLKVALDCANGAAHRVAPLIFKELDAELYSYSINPNGLNINESCGSLHPALIQEAVKRHQAHIGIALDGDADRVILVDEKGAVVDGDTILAICARDLKESGNLHGNTVVSTVMANLGMIKALESIGVRVAQAQVGDRHVIQEMVRLGSNLGGEQSGHMIFADYNTTGDGLVSALQVLRIMIEKGKPLSELASFVERYPQVCVNVKVKAKPDLKTLSHVQDMIEQGKQKLKDRGRVLVRYSGTEKICRVMVEGQEETTVREIADMIADSVAKSIGDK
ncbi:phosphoglucosamine mutase [Estrella lausannensis]|uniref:Phosphoglucosamine mutase n=1 Tax=Estrella lausannensis TaxID=483423 RepID=A0A0H5DTH0_9BACT|nr:phosphoglucosamine mutase [Estrella lausannensis]CRX39144.1 Phosphoglucosamine mutase [Estrella lausannensis]